MKVKFYYFHIAHSIFLWTSLFQLFKDCRMCSLSLPLAYFSCFYLCYKYQIKLQKIIQM